MKAKLKNIVKSAAVAVCVLIFFFRERSVEVLIRYFYWVPIFWVALPIIGTAWIVALGQHRDIEIDLKSSIIGKSILNAWLVYTAFTLSVILLVFALIMLLVLFGINILE